MGGRGRSLEKAEMSPALLSEDHLTRDSAVPAVSSCGSLLPSEDHLTRDSAVPAVSSCGSLLPRLFHYPWTSSLPLCDLFLVPFFLPGVLFVSAAAWLTVSFNISPFFFRELVVCASETLSSGLQQPCWALNKLPRQSVVPLDSHCGIK